MSIDTLTRAIIAETVAEAANVMSTTLTWSNERWELVIIGADADEYQEQGEFGARHRVIHVEVDAHTFAAITTTGSEDESAESVLRAALDFVRTETPVPA